MEGISAIGSRYNASPIKFKGQEHNMDVEKIRDLEEMKALASFKDEPMYDSLEIAHQNGDYELTKKDKQAIMKKARINASGWAIFGEGISTLYYALRSDKTIAKKYDLDVEKDKDFIKQIKKQQTLCTLPAAIPALGSGYAICTWLYNKLIKESSVSVKD